MKVIVDENLPVTLAEALAALFRGQHEVAHIITKFHKGIKDAEWISKLGQDGRWVVLSGDTRITRTKAERNAFLSSKLMGCFFSRSLMKAPLIKKMERLMAVWENLESVTASTSGGALYEVSMKTNRLRQIRSE